MTVTPVNDAPTAAHDTYSTEQDEVLHVPDPGVLANDTDVDDDLLTVVLITPPGSGTVLLDPTLGFVYTPASGYVGPDSFVYQLSDENDGTATATVSITVTPVNHAPTADGQAVSTPEDMPLGITLTGSDVDGDVLGFTVLSGPSQGTLSGTVPSLTYTPEADYAGPDSFTFVASDGSLASEPATVSITVTPVNDAPVAADDAYAAIEDIVLNVAPGVLGNDTDVEGTQLSAARDRAQFGRLDAECGRFVHLHPQCQFQRHR